MSLLFSCWHLRPTNFRMAILTVACVYAYQDHKRASGYWFHMKWTNNTKDLHYNLCFIHYGYVMSAMASQVTSVSMVCPAICSGAEQGKHQSSLSLAFVRGIHRWPVNSPYKRPVTWKMFSFDDVIIETQHNRCWSFFAQNPHAVLFDSWDEYHK